MDKKQETIETSGVAEGLVMVVVYLAGAAAIVGVLALLTTL